MGGEWLNNLRFADDVILIAKNIMELEGMVRELLEESRKAGLYINTNKTKIINSGEKCNISINGKIIEEVEDTAYLGQVISFKNKEKKRNILKDQEWLEKFRGSENHSWEQD